MRIWILTMIANTIACGYEVFFHKGWLMWDIILGFNQLIIITYLIMMLKYDYDYA